jgi:hypothetical protein
VGGIRSPWTAARATLATPGALPVALAGFLARGGIALFVLPILVPPSLVGLATFIGPASITPDGPTAGLIARIAIAVGLAGAALLAGTTLGALAEIALIETARPVPDPSAPGLLRRVVLIRLVSLGPVALALGFGLQRLGEIAYLELTLPTDLVTPMPIRVAARAPEVVAAIVAAWLLGETWGGLATRLAVLRGASLVRSLVGGLIFIVRRIVLVVPVLLVSLALAGLVLGAVVALISWSFGLVRDALLGGAGPSGVLAMAGATLLFVGCWVGGLGAAAVLASWRGLAWTVLVGEDHRGSGGAGPERANL